MVDFSWAYPFTVTNSRWSGRNKLGDADTNHRQYRAISCLYGGSDGCEAAQILRSSGAQKATVTAAAVVGFSVASYIEIPMSPVPITAQTYALMVAAALLGWRLGLLATVGWLAIGAAGLPVLAGGASGLAHFTGSAGGYLVAFPLAVVVVALLAERGWNSGRLLLAFMAMLLGHLICLGVGGAWLASDIGVGLALRSGVLPYLPGGIIKSVLGVVTIAVVSQARSARRY